MKKHVAMLFFIIATLLTNQVQIVLALQKTYQWEKGYNDYQISIIISDYWQPNIPFEVTVRFTLTSKANLFNTKTNSVKVVLSSENFLIDSLNQEQTNDLTEVGHYWEKKFGFELAEKLNRGQTLNSSIVVIIDVDLVGIYTGYHWNEVWNNYDDPMTVSLFRPVLSTLELIAVVVALIVVIGGIIGFIVYRRKRTVAKPSTSPTQ